VKKNGRSDRDADQRQQDGNAHGHLLAGVGGQVEDADAEKRDEDARDDEVDRVEERLAADSQRERDESLVMMVCVRAL